MHRSNIPSRGRKFSLNIDVVFTPNVDLSDEPGVYADGKGSSSLANPGDGWGCFMRSPSDGASGVKTPKVHRGSMSGDVLKSLRPCRCVSADVYAYVEVYALSAFEAHLISKGTRRLKEERKIPRVRITVSLRRRNRN